jgi:hypothetical protein
MTSNGFKQMSALLWFTVGSFHVFGNFVTPLRLISAIRASWVTDINPT